MSLFRQEAIEGQRRRLYGDVTIHQPTSFAIITIVLATATATAAALGATMSFTKKESATGWVMPEQGIAEAFAPEGAVVQAVLVKTGQYVRRGQILAELSNEVYGADGSLDDKERRHASAQIAEAKQQIDQSRVRQLLSARQMLAQAASIDAGIVKLEETRLLQVQQLALARRQYDRAIPLVTKGFISKFDQDRREQAVLTNQQAVADFERQIQDQRSQAATLRSNAADTALKQQVDESQLRASISTLDTTIADIDYKRAATLRAPASGEVVAVNVDAGQTTRRTMPVVAIAPTGRLGAELLLPTRNSGFVRPGQATRIVIDAFPFQHFGAIAGQIVRVDHSAVTPAEFLAPIEVKGAAYRVWVALDRDTVSADGVRRRLRPGMTLQADIITDRRTLLQWLLDPLLGMSRRF